MTVTTPRPSVDEAMRAAHACLGYEQGALITDDCRQPMVTDRQIAMAAVRAATAASYPTIGDAFGRHHTTVMHACERFGEHPAIDRIIRSSWVLAAERHAGVDADGARALLARAADGLRQAASLIDAAIADLDNLGPSVV